MMTGKKFTIYNRGDIVFVPFPFTDLSSTKTRPAVVISTNDFVDKMGSITVAMITSVFHNTKYDYEIKEWQKSNLLSPSCIRAKIVRHKPGKLMIDDLNGVMQIIRISLGL